jgi:hypothetical protein
MSIVDGFTFCICMMDNLNIYEVQVLGGILDNALKDRASFVRVELD